ncbi:hypothetical protein OKW96_16815 [Sphingobacterium sp. KU25419]|nr:hypothetical protein OKW96_16815 [Sphingobacterium sp. KU25419]
MYKITKLSTLAAALAFSSFVSISEVNATSVSAHSRQVKSEGINIHLKEGNASQALVLLSQQTGLGIGYDKRVLQLEKVAVKERTFQTQALKRYCAIF